MSALSRLGVAARMLLLLVSVAAGAQVVVPPGSEVPIPPRPATDSAAQKGDTIHPPFGRATGGRSADIGPQYQWNRDQLFASGALTLVDLLEKVPWTTSFRSAWLASPKFVAHNGDFSRVRVYYDGIELDNLDPRTSPLLDLNTIELWTLENVLVTRFANELEIHLRSWAVERTDTYTRTDVFTGDEDTNIYRGFYGRRFGKGFGIQLGGQQYSTRARLGGGGDALAFMGRLGVARRLWSVDAMALRRGSSRTLQPTFSTTGDLSLAPFEGTHMLTYLRAGIGNTSGGPWAQLIASNMRFADRSPRITAAEAARDRIVGDTTDTTTRRLQFIAAAGVSRGILRASIHDRIREVEGEVYHAPGARAEVSHSLGSLSLYTETSQFSRSRRIDAMGRFTPLPYVAAGGAISSGVPYDDGIPGRPPRVTSARIEAGVRILNPWLIAGLITRDTALLPQPSVFDTAYSSRAIGRRNGVYAALRGKLFRDVNVDVLATRWDSATFYQPRYQARSEVNISTSWLSRFPSGTFGLKAAVVHDYRTRVLFPTSTSSRIAPGSSIFSGLLEIRILRGVASYQVRNLVTQNYQLVPGFFMPRTINIYGIRWEFLN